MNLEPNTSTNRANRSRQSNQQSHPPVLAQVERPAAQSRSNPNSSTGQGKYKEEGKSDNLLVATNARVLQIFTNLKSNNAQNFTP